MVEIDNLSSTANALITWLSEVGLDYGLKLLGAIVVLVIGFWVVKFISKRTAVVIDKTDITPALKTFVKSMLSVILKIILIISVLGMVGIEMTTFIAMLTAASLAIAMAFNGTLANFAGGVMILFFKPFRIGDFIDAQGHMGTVKEIQIFVTILTTPDNKTIIIPNGGLSTGSMTNFSTEPNRRVDWSFSIAYGDDFDTAKAMILKMLKDDSRTLADPEPFIVLGAMADSSVNITVRAWVKAADYWTLFFDMNERFYKEAGKHGLSIPFPQLDVHLNK